MFSTANYIYRKQNLRQFFQEKFCNDLNLSMRMARFSCQINQSKTIFVTRKKIRFVTFTESSRKSRATWMIEFNRIPIFNFNCSSKHYFQMCPSSGSCAAIKLIASCKESEKLKKILRWHHFNNNSMFVKVQRNVLNNYLWINRKPAHLIRSINLHVESIVLWLLENCVILRLHTIVLNRVILERS